MFDVGCVRDFQQINFTRIPGPQKSAFEVRGMLERAVLLTGTSDRVRLDVEPSDLLIYAGERLIEQVVVNLLKNAREAVDGRSEGYVGVSACIASDETVRIDVSNNGGAIPAEVSDNIFTPFFTTKPCGSGIGLSVSRRIMQLHNGSLRLTSDTDSRVTFTLLFERESGPSGRSCRQIGFVRLLPPSFAAGKCKTAARVRPFFVVDRG